MLRSTLRLEKKLTLRDTDKIWHQTLTGNGD